jgi:hypothetical protein
MHYYIAQSATAIAAMHIPASEKTRLAIGQKRFPEARLR